MLIPFSPPPGLNSDETTFSAPGWADGNNVRFVNGKPQAIGGWAAYTGAMTGITRGMFAYSVDATTYLAAGNVGKLYRIGSGVAGDITPVGLGGGAGTIGWSFGAFGNNLLASPVNGTIYEYTGGATATEITQAPDVITGGILITPERQVLALACSEEVSGSTNYRVIRGCDLEDPTDWTSTTSNNAFEHVLDDPGKINAGRMIGPYVGVWTTASLWMGQFIGDPAQTYRFDRIGTGCGLLGMRCVSVAGQRAFWVTPDIRFFTWAPGSEPVALNCPISVELRKNLDFAVTGYLPFTVFNAFYRELWFFYPDKRDNTGDVSRYVAVNVDTGTWFKGQMARTAAVDTAGVFISTSTYPPHTMFMANASDLKIYRHEDAAAQSVVTWHVQSNDQYLEESRRRIMVKGIIPDFEDQSGNVSLTLYVRDRPHSTPVTKGPYTLTTSTTKKDFRASGKIMAAKFSGSGTYMRLGKPLFEAQPTGER